MDDTFLFKLGEVDVGDEDDRIASLLLGVMVQLAVNGDSHGTRGVGTLRVDYHG